MATITGMFDHYSVSDVAASMQPFALSPIPHTAPIPSSLTTKLFGLRTVPDLGPLTSWLLGPGDEAVVHRSWGLFDEGYLYGQKFVYHATIRARNAFVAVLWHLGMQLMMVGLAVWPIRWLAKRLVVQPGDGPDRT